MNYVSYVAPNLPMKVSQSPPGWIRLELQASATILEPSTENIHQLSKYLHLLGLRIKATFLNSYF